MKQNLTNNTTKKSKNLQFNQLNFSIYDKKRALEKVLLLKVGCLFLLQVISQLSEMFIIIILYL